MSNMLVNDRINREMGETGRMDPRTANNRPRETMPSQPNQGGASKVTYHAGQNMGSDRHSGYVKLTEEAGPSGTWELPMHDAQLNDVIIDIQQKDSGAQWMTGKNDDDDDTLSLTTRSDPGLRYNVVPQPSAPPKPPSTRKGKGRDTTHKRYLKDFLYREK